MTSGNWRSQSTPVTRARSGHDAQEARGDLHAFRRDTGRGPTSQRRHGAGRHQHGHVIMLDGGTDLPTYGCRRKSAEQDETVRTPAMSTAYFRITIRRVSR